VHIVHTRWMQLAPMLLFDLLLAPASTALGGQPVKRGEAGLQLGCRAAALTAVAAVYVGVRQAVTGGAQLVSIYRKACCPRVQLHACIIAQLHDQGHDC